MTEHTTEELITGENMEAARDEWFSEQMYHAAGISPQDTWAAGYFKAHAEAASRLEALTAENAMLQETYDALKPALARLSDMRLHLYGDLKEPYRPKTLVEMAADAIDNLKASEESLTAENARLKNLDMAGAALNDDLTSRLARVEGAAKEAIELIRALKPERARFRLEQSLSDPEGKS